MLRIWGVLLAALLLAGVVSAQVKQTDDLLPALEALAPVNASLTLSPDGTRAAWAAPGGLCLYDLDAEAGECHAFPDRFADSFGEYNPLRWSPDSTAIAFTEDPFRLLNESDVWVYKLASGEFTNLTDDGLEGGWLQSKTENAGFALDYALTWNPVNGDLYYFHSEPLADGWTLDLYRTTPGSYEAEQIGSYDVGLPTLSVYFPPQISPDGTRLAVIVLGQKLDDLRNGVWMIDLKDGGAEIIANLPNLRRSGFPEWQDQQYTMPRELAWVDNHTLLVNLLNSAFNTGVSWGTQIIDLTTGTITPLVDMSGVAEQSDLFQAGDDGHSPMYAMPRSVLIAADGASVLFTHYDPYGQDQPGLSRLPLPPAGTPVLLAETPDCRVTNLRGMPRFLQRIAPNGRVLLHNCLLTVEGG